MSWHSLSSYPQSHSSPASTILLPQKAPADAEKQFRFLLSFIASRTLDMFPMLQPENLLLFGRSPLVADANMMKLPFRPPGRHSGG